MATRRLLHVKISSCEQLGKVSSVAALLYTWGIPHASDWGVIPGSPATLKSLVFPLRPEGPAEIAQAIRELTRVGLLKRFKEKNKDYLWYPTFDEYQKGTLHKRSEHGRSGMPRPPMRLYEDDLTPTRDYKVEPEEQLSLIEVTPKQKPPKRKKKTEPKPTSALSQERRLQAEEILQAVWLQFDLPLQPDTAAWAAVMQLLKSYTVEDFEQWLCHVSSNGKDTPRYERPADPSQWAARVMREAMTRKWEWQRKKKSVALGPATADDFGEVRP